MGFFDTPFSQTTRLCNRDLVYPKWNGPRMVFRPAPVIEGNKVLPAFIKEKNDISRFAYSVIGAVMFGLEGRQQSCLLAPSSDLSAEDAKRMVEASPYFAFLENLYANEGLVTKLLSAELNDSVNLKQMLPRPTLLIYMNVVLFESDGIIYYDEDLGDDRFKTLQLRASAARDVQYKIKDLISSSVDFVAPSCPKLWYIYGKKNTHTEASEENKYWRIIIEDGMYSARKHQKQPITTTLSKPMLVKIRELLPPLSQSDFNFADEREQIRLLCKAFPLPRIIELGFKYNPQFMKIANDVLPESITSSSTEEEKFEESDGSILSAANEMAASHQQSSSATELDDFEESSSVLSGLNLGDELNLDSFGTDSPKGEFASESQDDDEFTL